MSKRDEQIDKYFKFKGTHLIPGKYKPAENPGSDLGSDSGEGLNTWHLAALTISLMVLFMAVIAILGGGG